MDPGRLWDASGRPLDGRSCPGSVRPLVGLDALGPRQVLTRGRSTVTGQQFTADGDEGLSPQKFGY